MDENENKNKNEKQSLSPKSDTISIKFSNFGQLRWTSYTSMFFYDLSAILVWRAVWTLYPACSTGIMWLK